MYLEYISYRHLPLYSEGYIQQGVPCFFDISTMLYDRALKNVPQTAILTKRSLSEQGIEGWMMQVEHLTAI